MRKTLFTLVTLALFVGQIIASPIDVDRAQRIGMKYLQSNYAKQVGTLSLAYTQMTESGQPALYVFNGDNSFVIVSADDAALPILGASDEHSFDYNDLPDGLAYMLRHYARQIQYAMENNLEADAETAEQWKNVSRTGMLKADRSISAVPPLFDLRWNQDCYYNMLCPTSSSWYAPCGHMYAGCVACAMSMVMKYWNWPDHGTGSHTYTPSGCPQQSANFESTNYDWNNMPVSLTASSSSAQKDAVARLMWHCGISVDMAYAADGSGASSYNVPNSLKQYFRYCDAVNIKSRNDYTKTQWEDLLIASFDRGIPCYYSGAEGQAGHAFVCLGYNNNRQFYFNWGWSNQYNNYYAIDALNTGNGTFNDYQTAIFDFIPDYIYNALIPAAENFGVEASNAHSKTGIVSWTNPTVNVSGETINNIEKVVLLRDGTEIFSQNNVAPGITMTFQDQVSQFDCYTYTVYYLSNNTKGYLATTSYQYGPTCTWKIVGQTSNFQGWNGGKIQLINSNNKVVEEITMTSSTPISQFVRVPEGNVSFKWVAPLTAISSVTINIKNSSNTSVYSFNGNTSNIPATMYSGNNDCDGCQPPTNLNGEYQWTSEGFGTKLSWNYDADPQSFKVYRSNDGVNYEVIATVNKEDREYFDVTGAGAYYYKVTAFRSYCESTPAWVNNDQDYVYVDVTSLNENENDCVNVYPNPANSILCIEAEGLELVTIYNVTGQMVYQQRCSEDGVVISTTSLAAGVYNLNIKTSQTTTTKRFSVMH